MQEVKSIITENITSKAQTDAETFYEEYTAIMSGKENTS